MEYSLDANDACAIARFLGNNRFLQSTTQRSLPGPARVAVTLHCSPEVVKYFKANVLRVFNLSGFVARHLSGRHSALKGVRDEADAVATGDTEDEI